MPSAATPTCSSRSSASNPDYLRASLDEMHQHFGSIDSYFVSADGLGLDIDAHGQQVLRYVLTD